MLERRERGEGGQGMERGGGRGPGEKRASGQRGHDQGPGIIFRTMNNKSPAFWAGDSEGLALKAAGA
jgi:hypothetical protein